MALTHFSKHQICDFGRRLLGSYHNAYPSFEGAAQALVDEIYAAITEEDGGSAFALLRLYRTMSYECLPLDLREQIHPTSARYLILMGTRGSEPQWCDRRRSRHHQIMPLDESLPPMFKGMFHEFGFDWQEAANQDVPHPHRGRNSFSEYFYLPEAAGSPFIPEQEEFVRRYGIGSVIAVGSQFISGDAYVLIGFGRCTCSAGQAEAFSELSVYVSTLLAAYDARNRLWE